MTMDNLESNTLRQNVLEPTNSIAYDRCIMEPDQEIVKCLDHSYLSWNTLGLNAFSAMSIGSCLLSVLTINGVVSLLSCNSVFSIMSLNSAFSILSTNSAFAIGCVDKRFAICW